jgi:hypothetical protein
MVQWKSKETPEIGPRQGHAPQKMVPTTAPRALTESCLGTSPDSYSPYPSDGDPAVYQKVVDLRERRMDQEEIVADFQKSIEGLRRENRVCLCRTVSSALSRALSFLLT